MMKTRDEVKAHDTLIRARTDRPRPEWIVGVCPECSSSLVQTSYRLYDKPRGAGSGLDGGRTVLVRECWNSLGAVARRTCGYRAEKGAAGFERGCQSAQEGEGRDQGEGQDYVDRINSGLV